MLWDSSAAVSASIGICLAESRLIWQDNPKQQRVFERRVELDRAIVVRRDVLRTSEAARTRTNVFHWGCARRPGFARRSGEVPGAARLHKMILATCAAIQPFAKSSFEPRLLCVASEHHFISVRRAAPGLYHDSLASILAHRLGRTIFFSLAFAHRVKKIILRNGLRSSHQKNDYLHQLLGQKDEFVRRGIATAEFGGTHKANHGGGVNKLTNNMANLAIPRPVAALILLATKMYQGLITLGTTLKITQITPVEFNTELNALIVADGEFNAARTAKQMASDLFKPADVALSEWLSVARNVLAARFGNRWSTMWAQAGFTNASTRVPSRLMDRLNLALNLAGFFTVNPSFEVPSMDVTAAQAATLRTAALNAQEAVTAADVVLKDKGTTWESAYATVTGSMRALINILHATLKNDDTRWLTFGLDMPSTITTPGQPVDVTAHVDENDGIVVQWDAVPLAQRYRTRMMIVGVDTEYSLAASSVDPMSGITGVSAGQTVQIIVQAVNGNSQGVASEPIRFTVPLLAKADTPAVTSTKPSATLLDEVVISSNGNGHRNGDRLPALS